MKKANPATPAHHRLNDPDFPSFWAEAPTRDEALRRLSGVSNKFPHTGLHGGEKDPEIYPVYQAAGQSSEHQVEPCEVCGKPKEDCAC